MKDALLHLHKSAFELTLSNLYVYVQERMAILESGFENIMTEVESQMSGIQVQENEYVSEC